MNQSGRQTPKFFPVHESPTRGDHDLALQTSLSDLASDVLTALRRSLLMVTLITAAAVALAVVAVNLITPKYEALGRLVIDQSLDANSGAPRRSDFFSDAMMIDSEVEGLVSRDLLTRVGERLALSGLGEPYAIDASSDHEARQEAIDALESGLSVERVESTFVIDVRFEAETPELAASVVNILMEEFRLWRQGVLMSYMGEAARILEEQIATSDAEVAEAERQVEEFKAASEMQSAASVSVLEREIAETTEDLFRTESILEALDNDLAAIERAQQNSEALSEADLNALPSDLSASLRSSVAELQEIAAAGGDAVRRGELVSQVEAILRSAAAPLESRRASVLPTVTTLREKGADLNSQLAEYRRYLIDLRGLERRAEALAARHVGLLGQLQSTRQETNLVINPARVLQTAVPPLQPTGLGPKALIAIATIAGLMAGLAFALLREQIDGSFRESRQLQSVTGAQFFGSLPMIPSSSVRKAPALTGIDETSLSRRQRDLFALFSIAARYPNSRSAKAMERSIFGIEHECGRPATISVVAALGGEGKSFFSSNLAFFLAMKGHSVLLVDADRRNRSLSKVLGPVSEAGKLEPDGQLAAAGAELRHISDNLHLVHLGDTVDADSRVSVEPARSLGASQPGPYDYIIMDTPPIAFMPEAMEVIRMSDASIMVVKWGSTRVSLVNRLLGQNPALMHSLIGAVFSQTDPSLQDRYEHLPSGHGYYEE